MRELILVILILIVAPVLVYFCVKFGTVGYFKARRFMEKEKPCCDSPSKEKCEQCQETGLANPNNR